MIFCHVSRLWLGGLVLVLVSGCNTPPRVPAPVESRSVGGRPASSPVSTPTSDVSAVNPSSKATPGAVHAGKPGV